MRGGKIVPSPLAECELTHCKNKSNGSPVVMNSPSAKVLHTRGILLLVLTTLIWASSFPLLKNVVSSLAPPVVVAIRFALAAIAFAPCMRGLNAQLLGDGILLGLVCFANSASALIGLQTTSANRGAFIISLNVILVPLLGMLLGQHLPIRVWFAALLALAGIGVMTWEDGGFSSGDLWMLGSAIGIAVYILMLEAAIQRHSALSLTAIQLFVMASLGIVWAMPQLVGIQAIASNFSVLLYLGLVGTAAPVLTQTMAQRWVSAHEAALIYTLEPVFAAVFSFWLLGEEFETRGLLGAGLVLFAMVLSQR